jgi:hypothetical protein
MRQALAAALLLLLLAAPAAYFLDDGSMLHPFRHAVSDVGPIDIHAAPLTSSDLRAISRGVNGLAATIREDMPASASSGNDAPRWLSGHEAALTAERVAALASMPAPDVGIMPVASSSLPSAATDIAADPVSTASSIWEEYTAGLEAAAMPAAAVTSAAVKARDAGGTPNAVEAGNDRTATDWHDLAEIYLWTLRAAGRGDAAAELELARMYDQGLGVARRPAEARRWLAAAHGLAATDQHSEAAVPGATVSAGTGRAAPIVPLGQGPSEGLVALTEPTAALSDLQ